MNIELIKAWFGQLQLRRLDWRIRWPLMLLPFLLPALLLTLLAANRASTKALTANQQLQQQVQQQIQQSLKPESAPQLIAQRMQEIETQSTALWQWLLKGRNATSHAAFAESLSGLASGFLSSGAEVPSTQFWESFSNLLADLEDAVRLGIITTPESKQAIADIRARYASLRSLSIDTANGSNTVSAPRVQSGALSRINDGLDLLTAQRAAATRLQNRALVLAALSCGLLGLLLWGLWRRVSSGAALVAHTEPNQSQLDAEAQDKNRSEQAAILQLLDEISPLAEGDLRVNATVSEASTGAVADAFNYAVYELRRLVRAVMNSADLVKTSVTETRNSAQDLAKASSVQAREIHRSSNYLNVMSDTMAQLSAHAVESARIADESVKHARNGGSALKSNVEGLTRIRDKAEMTTRLMQRLLTTSETINERVNDIQAVAKRTDLLALNTTIKTAAMVSNGSPDNMSVVSDEVAHLAASLGRASREIASLSDIIYQDATLTLESMASTNTELDDGQLKAQQASQCLNEIDRVSNELSGLISDIASKSLRQAGVVKQLSANMGVINNITRESALGLHSSAKALDELQLITAQLRDSVSDFKLPEPKVKQANKKSRFWQREKSGAVDHG